MALIIALRNISALAPVSDYEYTVFINDTVIEKGSVKGHTRADGWHMLVRKLLDQRDDLEEQYEAELIQQRVLGHGDGQQYAIDDVNAGRVDDLIQPRLKPLLTRIKELEAELVEWKKVEYEK